MGGRTHAPGLTTLALRHRQGRPQEAAALLAPILGWFTEGFDTADLKEAKALLDKLTEPPFRDEAGKVRNRRNLVVATRSGEGPFTIRFADLRHRALPACRRMRRGDRACERSRPTPNYPGGGAARGMSRRWGAIGHRGQWEHRPGPPARPL